MKKAIYYINVRTMYGVETVDHFETLKESKEMVKEYNQSDKTQHYYISSRSTKEYREAIKE